MPKSFGSLVFTPAVKALQERYGSRRQYAQIERQSERAGGLGPDKQYISTGNLMKDNRVALILMDYPRQLRLKILGRAEIFEGDEAKDWLPKVRDPEYKAVTERVYVIRIEAFDWNCQQHITPRFTVEEIRSVLEPIEKEMQELHQENEQLRETFARLNSGKPH
jgi:predicted pyridoxine 5'-phosphate oxidase superfamily flavin-nucleotide-binding protein